VAKGSEVAFPKATETKDQNHKPDGPDPSRLKTLEQEVMDLKITNRAKDYFIDQLQKERTANLEQLVESSRKIGELETKLLQLAAPGTESSSVGDAVRISSTEN